MLGLNPLATLPLAETEDLVLSYQIVEYNANRVVYVSAGPQKALVRK